MAVDLEKVSRGAAISRGIESFIELTLFYGLLFSIAVYDMHRRSKEGKTAVLRMKDLEKT